MVAPWWGVALLVLAPLALGWLIGDLIATALAMRDLRRAGLHRQPAATPDRDP